MSKKLIKAWICVYPEEEVTCSPLIKFIKPLQREVKSDRKFGVKTYECEITYRLKDELK